MVTAHERETVLIIFIPFSGIGVCVFKLLLICVALLSVSDHRDAVVLLICRMTLTPMETEGGSVDTTTLERHN